MRNYLIPLVYVSFALAAGLTLPRFELAYFPAYANNVAVDSALATLGAVASGMMALTAIIFPLRTSPCSSARLLTRHGWRFGTPMIHACFMRWGSS